MAMKHNNFLRGNTSSNWLFHYTVIFVFTGLVGAFNPFFRELETLSRPKRDSKNRGGLGGPVSFHTLRITGPCQKDGFGYFFRKGLGSPNHQ